MDGESIASVPRSIYDPHPIAFALLDVDAAPRYLGPPDVAPDVIDETRVGNTFVSGRIAGIEILGGSLE